MSKHTADEIRDVVPISLKALLITVGFGVKFQTDTLDPLHKKDTNSEPKTSQTRFESSCDKGKVKTNLRV